MAWGKAVGIELMQAERHELETRSRRRKIGRADAIRAAIVLSAAEGLSNVAIAERVGVTGVPAYPTEVAVLAALVGQALPGDVVGLMCHAEREECYEWIQEHGGVADSAETLAAKVRAAAG